MKQDGSTLTRLEAEMLNLHKDGWTWIGSDPSGLWVGHMDKLEYVEDVDANRDIYTLYDAGTIMIEDWLLTHGITPPEVEG